MPGTHSVYWEAKVLPSVDLCPVDFVSNQTLDLRNSDLACAPSCPDSNHQRLKEAYHEFDR